MNIDTATLLKQIEPIDTMFDNLKKRTRHADFSDIPLAEGQQFVTTCLSCLIRLTGEESEYIKQARIATNRYPKTFWHESIPEVHGIIQSLKMDINNGFMTSVRELIHADVFSDFLDMADYLVGEGYKDASAVVGGSVLENHLRKLCVKSGIDLTFIDAQGKVKPKKADTLNAELVKANAYNKNQSKLVTAWLGIRNSAAHGDYSDYNTDQVKTLLLGVRQFLSMTPA